jgi:hypothetical protein
MGGIASGTVGSVHSGFLEGDFRTGVVVVIDADWSIIGRCRLVGFLCRPSIISLIPKGWRQEWCVLPCILSVTAMRIAVFCSVSYCFSDASAGGCHRTAARAQTVPSFSERWFPLPLSLSTVMNTQLSCAYNDREFLVLCHPDMAGEREPKCCRAYLGPFPKVCTREAMKQGSFMLL